MLLHFFVTWQYSSNDSCLWGGWEFMLFNVSGACFLLQGRVFSVYLWVSICRAFLKSLILSCLVMGLPVFLLSELSLLYYIIYMLEITKYKKGCWGWQICWSSIRRVRRHYFLHRWYAICHNWEVAAGRIFKCIVHYIYNCFVLFMRSLAL
jgi:hypothetical protein